MAAELTATYRLQMNAGFTLAAAHRQIDYFDRLGVSHLYLSPILGARRGSMHGYDVTDPTRINPEIGDESELRSLAADLRARGMGLIVDIVPNHMGIGAENPYWEDVLTHGERSRYAQWFDIDWVGGEHKVILPILGDELDKVLERGELSVRVKEKEDPRLAYFTNSFPLDPATLPPELQLTTFDAEETGELANLFTGPKGRERLEKLLADQHYRLAFWRRAPDEINYRRFFDVNDLAALRMEDAAVFSQTHAYILGLVRDGVVDGLRIDHIDGLLDPVAYLRRLREAVGPETPLFVEKILSPGEKLRSDWPVQGTTGYEFLNDLEDVFLDPAGFTEIESAYRDARRLGDKTFHDIAREGKRRFLTGPLGADVGRLVRMVAPLAKRAHKHWTRDELRTAIVEFMVAMPVYRTYIDARMPATESDRALIDQARREAAETSPSSAEAIGFIADMLSGDVPDVDPAARALFAERLQQVSGPSTAKGVEDTAIYVYHPLASRNEVGGAPDRPLDNAVARFHEANAERAKEWPLSLTATNTHDTKRSADVRARIAVVSEMPDEWSRSIRRWRRLNAQHKKTVRGRPAPDGNTEYLLYQMLVALWPAPRAGRRSDDLPERAWRDAARERLERYMLKAAKEAKTRTSWTEPDEEYEKALKEFIAAILKPAEDAPFLTDVARLVSTIAFAGARNSLARVALHLTAPGTPDTYQGDELWNYTLVDPDNRQQVDFGARGSLVSEPAGGASFELVGRRAKLDLVTRLLQLRRKRAELFQRGGYLPLEAVGAKAAHVVAFARSLGDQHVITVAPRLTQSLDQREGGAWWGDTRLVLPDALRGGGWRAVLEPAAEIGSETLELGVLLRTIPVAVLDR